MSDFEKAMKWFKWAAGAGNQFEIVNAEIERQAKRIEELESDNSVFKRMAKNYGDELAKIHNEDHIITDEQIDAAWAYHTNECVGCEIIFRKLGIKRCEGCGGKPLGVTDYGETYTSCLICNGHGWVINAL